MKQGKDLWWSMKRKYVRCLCFPFISTLQSAAFWSCNSGLHSQLSLRWFVLCKIANSVAISFVHWNKRNLLLFKLGPKSKFTLFLNSSRLSFRGFKWYNCIVFGPTTSPTEKNNLQSEYFSASCKAHCSVSWGKKKSKAYLISVNRGPLSYMFSKLLYKSELHKK